MSNFRNTIKVNTKNLLDPSVCRGEKFFPNVLRSLGANEDVIKNPVVINQIELYIKKLTSQIGINISNEYQQNPTKQQIEDVVNAIRTNGILSRGQREKRYNEEDIKDYYGIAIDEKTGFVTTQKLETIRDEVRKFCSNMKETTYSSDGKGNTIANTSHYRNLIEEYLIKTNMIEYNPDGIVMRAEFKSYEHKDGKDVICHHIIKERLKQYPFVVKEETSVNNFRYGRQPGIIYYCMDSKDLSQLGGEYNIDSRGNSTVLFEFSTDEQVSQYYYNNKEIIKLDFDKLPECSSLQLGVILREGLRKLAKEAGVIDKKTKTK